MEQDRYQQNKTLFVTGLFCLLLSLSLLAFGLYILPFLLWEWKYNVPEFVINWREQLRMYYNFSYAGAAFFIFFCFIIPAAFFGYISYIASNRIENEIYGIRRDEVDAVKAEVHRRDVQETLGFGAKVFLLILLVIIAVLLTQWIIASPS